MEDKQQVKKDFERSRTRAIQNFTKLMRSETKVDRKQRYDEYLKELTTNKHEQMKRNLVDLIDEIHSTEQREIERDINRVKDEMRQWQQKEYEPVNFENFLSSRIHQLEIQEQKHRDFQEQLALCDSYAVSKKKLKQLKDICVEHDMPNFVENQIELSERQMIDHFVNGVTNSFHEFKSGGASIDRTLFNQGFKQKPMTEGERHIKEVIEAERERKKGRLKIIKEQQNVHTLSKKEEFMKKKKQNEKRLMNLVTVTQN